MKKQEQVQVGGHAVRCSTCDLRSVKATQHGTEKPGAQGELTWKWDSRDSQVIVGERLRVNKMAQVSVQTVNLVGGQQQSPALKIVDKPKNK